MMYGIIWRRRRDSTRLCLVFASQKSYFMSVLLCLTAYRRTWTNRVRVSRTKKIIPHTEWCMELFGAEGETRQGSALSLLRKILFICPCSSACRHTVAHGRTEFESLEQKNNSTHRMVYGIIWRRRRDSNSRTGFPAYALSRGASSPT